MTGKAVKRIKRSFPTRVSTSPVLVIEALQSRIPDLQLSEDQIRNADHARQSLAQLKENWAQQADRRQGHHRIEAVRYRAHDASTKTLRGL